MIAKSYFNAITTNPSNDCHGVLIFLHGCGSTNFTLKAAVNYLLGEELKFKHLRVLYLTAPVKPYSRCDGELLNIWFDRLDLEYDSPEQWKSVDEMGEKLSRVIDEVSESGIPLNKIILGGHSMGGCMALHVGLRFRTDIGGVFTLASFLNSDSKVDSDLRDRKLCSHPKLLMIHGSEDEDVIVEWSQKTRERLESFGVKPTYEVVEGGDHQLSKDSLLRFKDWVSMNFDF